MASSAVCTIISKNYLAYARTLADTYLAHNPGGEVYVLLVDRLDGYFDPDAERFKLVLLEDIGIEGLNELLFKYSVTELNTAVKPFFMEYLFKTHGLDKLIYFDPDIMILDSIGELWDLLDTHSIILTPHLTAQIKDDLKISEYNVLLAGAYNLGFIALRATDNVREFLSWWGRKLRKYCYVDPLKGYFVDQKWIDLVPGMFEGIYILKDPAYNTAYWNLHHRKFEIRDGKYLVNGRPAIFFHFSGFKPDEVEIISRHQSRFTLGNREDLRPLFYTYRELLLGRGHEEYIKWPYAFSTFDNGVKIPEIARRAYGYLPGKDAAAFGDPFKTGGEHSFYNWLNEKVSTREGKEGIKRLWHEVYRLRVDAQVFYSDVFETDWAGFVQWCLSVNEAELHLPEVFLPDGPDRGASAEILALRSETAEQSGIIEEKSRVIEEQERVIGKQAEILKSQVLEIDDMKKTISVLLNSASWKITKPVRWLSGIVKGRGQASGRTGG